MNVGRVYKIASRWGVEEVAVANLLYKSQIAGTFRVYLAGYSTGLAHRCRDWRAC